MGWSLSARLSERRDRGRGGDQQTRSFRDRHSTGPCVNQRARLRLAQGTLEERSVSSMVFGKEACRTCAACDRCAFVCLRFFLTFLKLLPSQFHSPPTRC